MDGLIKSVDSTDLHLTTCVGSGAYGEVWKATWKGKGGGIPVAVKKIQIFGATQEIQKETLAEVEILAKLRHTHILQVFGACVVLRELWIVTEFVAGGSLFDLIYSTVELSWKTRIRLAYQAAVALNVLHANIPVVIHRDIKSPNFLVMMDLSQVKLIDFGVSKVCTAISTVPREAIGTIRWGAPETFIYPPKWSTKSDIYSLGMTFYELASRKMPFDEIVDNDRVMYFVSKQQARPDVPSDTPKIFRQLITECWDHNIDSRPTSDQVVERLQNLVESYDMDFSTNLPRPPLPQPSSPPLPQHSSPPRRPLSPSLDPSIITALRLNELQNKQLMQNE